MCAAAAVARAETTRCALVSSTGLRRTPHPRLPSHTACDVMGVREAAHRRRASMHVRTASMMPILWAAMCTSARAAPFEYSGSASAAATLDYNPRVAHSPATISFSAETNIEAVPAGSEIEVSLPGFSVCEDFCTVTTLPVALDLAQNVDANAIWHELRKKLTITTSAGVDQGSTMSAAIPVSVGLRLPRAGVLQDEPSLTIGGTSCRSPAVGSFVPPQGTGRDTAIQYRMVAGGAVKAGQRITLVLSFLHRMKLVNGDIVTVTLPYFNGASFADDQVKTIPGKGYFSASWDALAFKLNLRWVSDPSGSVLDPPDSLHVIEVRDRLSIASDGVGRNDARITIETNALFGPVVATPIVSSPEVIGVVASSSLSFCDSDCTFNGFEWNRVTIPARPAESAEITFTFKFREDIQPGETVVLRLPGFDGPDRAAIPLSIQPLCRVGAQLLADSSDPDALEQHPYGCANNDECVHLQYAGTAILNRASWSRAAQTLTMTAGKIAAKEVIHVVVVPEHAQITLPSSGVRANSTAITLERCGIPCDNGPIPPTPARAVMAVGALQNLSLSFEPALPHVATTIEISFTPAMDLEAGDVLKVTLLTIDDSNVATGGALSLAASTGPFNTALWSSPSRTLTLACALSSAAGVQIRFSIPNTYGFRLPLDGVVPGSFQNLFSLEAAHGSISKTRIVQVQRVPAVLDSTILSYSSPSQSSPKASSGFGFSNLTFQFTARKKLTQGDVIVLHLTRFSGRHTSELPGSNLANVVSSIRQPDLSFQPAPYVQSYSFDPRNATLSFQLKSDVELDETIQIKFLQSAGISLPVFGIDANSTLLTVSIHFANSLEMPAVPIATSPAISPVLTTASLNFGNVRAGRATQLVVHVTPAFAGGFLRGDTISVRLRDFGFQAPSPISAAILTKHYFGEAHLQGDLLTFIVHHPFVRSVNATLSELAGIVLPSKGVRTATQDITIEGFVRSRGSFYSTPIPHVQAVGAFQGSVALTFTGTDPGIDRPPVAGLTTGIRLRFRTHMVLHPGDTVTLGLAGFTGVSKSRIDPDLANPSEGLTSVPPDAFRRASWIASGLLVLTVGSKEPNAALTEFVVAVPPNILYMPVMGLVSCSDSFFSRPNATCPIYVSALAREGDVLTDPRTWVTDYLSVGMLEFSSVTFTPARAGVPVEIDLQFRLSQNIENNFILSVRFDRFTMSGNFRQQAVTKVFGSTLFSEANIFWQRSTNPNRVELFFTSTGQAPAGELLHIRVPIAADITMPPRGLSLEDGPAVLMTILDAATPPSQVVADVPIRDIGRIGALMYPSFKLDPPSAGYVAEFSIHFTVTMAMHPGEFIIFHVPSFTGPPVSVVSVISERCVSSGDTSSGDTVVCEQVPYITTVRWTADTECLNATVSQEIPVDTMVHVIIGRDARVAIPGSGLPPGALSSVMFASTWARHGQIFRQPIPTSSSIDAILSVKRLEVMPKRASEQTELKISLLVRTSLNPGATILVYMPGFTGGKYCWDALPGDPDMQLRCLAASRAETCGTARTKACSPDDLRFCGDFSPYLNAFLKKPTGGCRFQARTYLGSHSKPLNFPTITKQVCTSGARCVLCRLTGVQL